MTSLRLGEAVGAEACGALSGTCPRSSTSSRASSGRYHFDAVDLGIALETQTKPVYSSAAETLMTYDKYLPADNPFLAGQGRRPETA